MRIASFNIWNHDKNYELRMDLLVELFRSKKFDIIALQEVHDELIVKRIASECNYEYTYWKKYFDCQEGLAILSKYRIDATWTNWDDNEDTHNSGLMFVKCFVNGKYINIMNVHLDYKRASYREIEVLKAIDYLENCGEGYKLMLGDFNTTQNSSVYRFLTGRQSINGKDAWWVDLAESYCLRRDLKLEATIDFINNPRWLGMSTLEVPSRFDWILLEEPYPNENPELTEYDLIGKIPSNGMTPSDHYGKMAEINFPT